MPGRPQSGGTRHRSAPFARFVLAFRPMPPLILIVDDEAIIREVLGVFLEDEGYRVAEAPDGAAALDVVERQPPDLILSDVMMPHVDGPELLRRLRARGVAVPVILLSAGSASVDLPGVRLVRKPFDVEQVVREVGSSLGGTA